MTVYTITLRSVTGQEFEREFATMTERELFKLTLPSLRAWGGPTVIAEALLERQAE